MKSVSFALGGGQGYKGKLSSGSAAGTAGANGGTSSFGSMLSALGGAGGVRSSNAQAQQGGALGGSILYDNKTDGSYTHYYYYGGAGAGGWYPGLPLFVACAITSINTDVIPGMLETTAGTLFTTATKFGGGGVCMAGNYNGIGGKSGSRAQNNTNTAVHHYLPGGGGAGYGAGGGGILGYSSSYVGRYDDGYGGNAGQLKTITTQLTSMSNIAVTVGAAGGGTASGAGAPGCVAVFW